MELGGNSDPLALADHLADGILPSSLAAGVHRDGNEALLHQVDDLLGPDGGRTARGAGRSTDGMRCPARARPNENWLALASPLLQRVIQAQQPVNLPE